MKGRTGAVATVVIVAVAGALAVAYYLRREVAASAVPEPVREGPHPTIDNEPMAVVEVPEVAPTSPAVIPEGEEHVGTPEG